MGARVDAALTFVVLLAAAVAYVLVDAALSVPFLIGGAVGTLAFELVANRDREAVREYWERPVVQAVSVGFSLGGVAVGAAVAASVVLSFVFGSLVTYLGYLFATAVLR